jgi:hypothetical protein
LYIAILIITSSLVYFTSFYDSRSRTIKKLPYLKA